MNGSNLPKRVEIKSEKPREKPKDEHDETKPLSFTLRLNNRYPLMIHYIMSYFGSSLESFNKMDR